MTDTGLRVERSVDGIATLVIDRPRRSNAITPALAEEMHRALTDLAADTAVRVVLLRGAGGGAFCGGYDLGEVTSGVRDDELQAMLGRLRMLPVPTIAVVDGHAVGAGFDLACSCDLRVVRSGSRIGLPAVRIGVAYDAEGLRRIVARIPTARTFLLTGELVPGEETAGFADVVATPDDLEERVAELSASLLRASPASLAYMAAIVRPFADFDPVVARKLRDEVLDGPDAALAAEARARDETPVFGPRTGGRVP